MKNPFKNPFKKRGLPDCAFHDGHTQHHPINMHHQNDASSSSSSSSAVTTMPSNSNMVSEPTYPAGYPYNPNYAHNTHPHTPQPPTAYPYIPPQSDQWHSSGAVWEFNTGCNQNKNGDQKGGDIKVGNIVGGSSLPIPLPQNHRIVFNSGRNTNEGGNQENGSVEFNNVTT